MDVSEIVYIVKDAQEFWSELEDILCIHDDCTLDQLDNTLRRFISFCAAYHERYLQSPLQLEHACGMAAKSELFIYHSKRMFSLLVKDAQTNTDPHIQMILYNVMLTCGRSNATFLRSQELWQPLLPWLMDHVRLDVDPELDYGFYGAASGPSSSARAIVIPIEAKLRFSAVKLLYEVCRFQNMSLQALAIFDDFFIDHLFDLVEQTRELHDETFNYSVIKLIVALNERFMVAALPPHNLHSPQPHIAGFAQQQSDPQASDSNRILRVLVSRHGSSPTFGVNLIFMLNRAERTAEDLCMQLLVLKFLYLLFNTKSMAEFFYTNDLCVLVDVFLREIVDIDEDNESLRHTYLRVLHPLLTKTQLHNIEYKRPQLVHMLESLLENQSIRDVNPTTKRLVERCMSGNWCVPFKKPNPSTPTERAFPTYDEGIRRGDSPAAVSVAQAPHSAGPYGPDAVQSDVRRRESARGLHLKASRSVEHVPLPSSSTTSNKQRSASGQHHTHGSSSNAHTRNESKSAVRPGSGDSLPRIATAVAHPVSQSAKSRARGASFDVGAAAAGFSALAIDSRATTVDSMATGSPRVIVANRVSESPPPLIRVSPTSPAHPGRLIPTPPSSASSSESASSQGTPSSKVSRRRAPPPPPSAGRRKPPAIPSRQSKLGQNGGALNVMAASSQPNLLAFSGMKTS